MDEPVLLFDGRCNLCRNIVRWIVENDPGKRLRFAALGSEIGGQLLAQHGMPASYRESAVLVDGGKHWTQSDAVLRTLRYLDSPWREAEHVDVLPKILRDWGYRRVSNNRPVISKVLGTIDEPWTPPAKYRDRFLDAAESAPGTTMHPAEHKD